MFKIKITTNEEVGFYCGIFDVENEKQVLYYKTTHNDSISHFQQLNDGRIATSSSDKTIRIGDVISIDNEKGTVQKIGLRNTTIINQDKHIITIPNSLLNSKHYKKFSPFEDYRIDVLVTIPHNIKLDKFKENVLEIMNKYEWISEEKLPSIKGDSLTEYGPKIKISAWTKNYNMLDSGKLIIINDINQLIYNKYLEN